MTKDWEILENLTRPQWIEVYNALPVGGATHRLMKIDSRIESEGMSTAEVQKLEGHARGIYSAVWQRVHNPGGLYSNDAAGKRWRWDMGRLLEALDRFAYCEMCGAEPRQPHQQDVLEGKTGKKPTTLHKWKAADGVYHRLCMYCRAGARQLPGALSAAEYKDVIPAPDFAPEDTEKLVATLKAVRDYQGQFLDAIYHLEALSGIEMIDPATDFRKVTINQVEAQAIPAVQVYTLLISHPDGNEVSVHTTDEDATRVLAAYVRTNWDITDDEDEAVEIPADDQDAIEAYFYPGALGERENESYQLEDALIEGLSIAQAPLDDGFIGPCVKCLTQCIDGGEGTVFCPKCKALEIEAEFRDIVLGTAPGNATAVTR